MRIAFTFFTYRYLLCPGRTKVPKYLSRRLWKKKKEESERKKKKRLSRREGKREMGRGVVESGHVTGRRGAKRRTRHRPPPGASPAAPCLSFPVSIFLLSLRLRSPTPPRPSSFFGPLTPPPSTLANPSACWAFFASHSASPLPFPPYAGGQY